MVAEGASDGREAEAQFEEIPAPDGEKARMDEASLMVRTGDHRSIEQWPEHYVEPIVADGKRVDIQQDDLLGPAGQHAEVESGAVADVDW